MVAPEFINFGNLRKAAILLASLDRDLAAEICTHLPQDAVRPLAEEMANLGPVDPEEQGEVLEEFTSTAHRALSIGGADFAHSVLAQATGETTEFGSELARLRALAHRDIQMLWRIIQNETPQTIAVMISQLPAAKVAEILEFMDTERRGEIAYRTANLGTLAPGVLEILVDAIEGQVVRLRPEATEQEDQSSGLEFLVQVFEHLDRTLEKEILKALSNINEAFGEQVNEQLVTFEDIFSLEDKSLQALLRQIDSATLALALKRVARNLEQRVMDNLSTRARQILQEEIDLLGTVKVADVGVAQKTITDLARQLDEAGEISLRSGEDEYVQ